MIQTRSFNTVTINEKWYDKTVWWKIKVTIDEGKQGGTMSYYRKFYIFFFSITCVLRTIEQSMESIENPLPFLSNGKNVYGVSDWNRRKSLDSCAAFGESCGVAAVWVIIGGTIGKLVSVTKPKQTIVLCRAISGCRLKYTRWKEYTTSTGLENNRYDQALKGRGFLDLFAGHYVGLFYPGRVRGFNVHVSRGWK